MFLFGCNIKFVCIWFVVKEMYNKIIISKKRFYNSCSASNVRVWRSYTPHKRQDLNLPCETIYLILK